MCRSSAYGCARIGRRGEQPFWGLPSGRQRYKLVLPYSANVAKKKDEDLNGYTKPFLSLCIDDNSK